MRIDTSGDSFVLFHRAMKSVYRPSKLHSEATVRGERLGRSTRPASSVLHDRLKRAMDVRSLTSGKFHKAGAKPRHNSPKVKMTLSQSSAVSTDSSHRSVTCSTSLDKGIVLTQESGMGSGRLPSLASHPPSDDGIISLFHALT